MVHDAAEGASTGGEGALYGDGGEEAVGCLVAADAEPTCAELIDEVGTDDIRVAELEGCYKTAPPLLSSASACAAHTRRSPYRERLSAENLDENHNRLRPSWAPCSHSSLLSKPTKV
jgi:hypothetical protein